MVVMATLHKVRVWLCGCSRERIGSFWLAGLCDAARSQHGTMQRNVACTWRVTLCQSINTFWLAGADDLRQLADHVGAEQFFVAGMSGGGPYTLAAVSHLEPRVLGAVVNCSAASVGALS